MGYREWFKRVAGVTLAALLLAGSGAPAVAVGVEVATPQGVYYVAPDGDDANPGSMDHPWQTIQKAADTLVAGDTVYIRAGTYTERVVPLRSGTAGSIITYAAYPGEVVTLDGTGVAVSEDQGLFDVSGQSHIRVSNLHLIHSAYYGILADNSSHITIEKNYTEDTYSSGISIWSSDNILVDGNEVVAACYGGWQEHITLAGTDTFEVRNNHVHGVRPGDDGKEGIGVKDGSSNGKVYRNGVHDLQHEGIYVDAWDKHTYNIEVYQNVIHDVAADGFALASEQGGLLEDIHLYNNIAYDNRYVGIWLSACCLEPTLLSPMKDIFIVNNTLYNNGWDPWGGGIGVENPDITHLVIRNNLVSQNLYFQIAVDPAVPMAQLTVDHNLIDGFRGTEGEIYGTDFLEANPLFVNPLGADFHLQGISPAIDVGSATDAPASDFDGNLRPQDGNNDGTAGYDIGADEVPHFIAQVFLPMVVR